MFESLDDLIAESHFPVVVVIALRCLTVMVTTEIFFNKINANIDLSSIKTTYNLQMSHGLKKQVPYLCLKSFKISITLVWSYII